MAVLGNEGALATGVVAILATGVAGTGVNASYNFEVQPTSNGSPKDLWLLCIAGTLPTTLTASVEASPDGGTTWVTFASAVALVASTASTAQRIQSVPAGLNYRLNFSAYTAGSASAVKVYGVVS